MHSNQSKNTFTSTNIKWYSYFNNNTCAVEDSLLNNICIYPNTILFAKMNNNAPKFGKFDCMQDFYNYFTLTKKKNQTFYAVLTHSARYIYIDIDYKLTHVERSINKDDLISIIINTLNQFVNRYGKLFNIIFTNCNWMIWDASRTEKFSLHVMDIGNIIHVKDNKHFAMAYNYWLHHNKKIPIDCIIDSQIYHENYQLWRLPCNHNGNINATLQLYNSKISILKQFEYSFMNNIRNFNICYKSKSFILPVLSNTSTNMSIKINKIKQDTFNNKRNMVSSNYNQATNSQIITKPTHTIMKQLQCIFKTHNITKYKNELLLKIHYCPIADIYHKHNTGRIKLIQNTQHTNLLYCKYYCMKRECKLIAKSKNITLQTWKYPWILILLTNCNDTILKQIDLLFNLLFTGNFIKYRLGTYQDHVLKPNKLKLNDNDMLFSTFINDSIIHTTCKKSNMFVYHKQNQETKTIIYCKECNISMSLSQDKIIVLS